MIPSPRAVSPGSITCFFRPRRGPTPETTSSPGCAIAVGPGVTAGLSGAESHRILLDGKDLDLACARRVLEEMAPEPVALHLESSFPLGCGFGVSASACLAAAFALDQRYELGLDRETLGMIAHRAEVLERSGLGDVAAQLVGGVVHRRCESGPLDAERLELEPAELHGRILGTLDTGTVLRSESLRSGIERAGRDALFWLEERGDGLTLPELLVRSRRFVQECGLLDDSTLGPLLGSEVHDFLADDTVPGSLALLGRTLITTEAPASSAAWIPLPIAAEGTRAL